MLTQWQRGTAKCEVIISAGEQCKCYATQKVNEIPLCDQHARKELRAIAGNETAPIVGPEGRRA
jgi:hypothetical protein